MSATDAPIALTLLPCLLIFGYLTWVTVANRKAANAAEKTLLTLARAGVPRFNTYREAVFSPGEDERPAHNYLTPFTREERTQIAAAFETYRANPDLTVMSAAFLTWWLIEVRRHKQDPALLISALRCPLSHDEIRSHLDGTRPLTKNDVDFFAALA